jgi:hypothetical protein
MTAQRSLKQRIRARRAETGETYTAARREVMKQREARTVDVAGIVALDGWTFTAEIRDDEEERAGK